MQTYRVQLSGTIYIDIEADNASEARSKAEGMPVAIWDHLAFEEPEVEVWPVDPDEEENT